MLELGWAARQQKADSSRKNGAMAQSTSLRSK